MSLWAVARTDIRNVGRSRLLWGVGGLVTAAFLSVVLTQPVPDDQPATDVATAAIGGLFGVTALLLPIAVIPIGAFAISGDRASGAIRYLLGLPNTRFDVYVGKLASRLTIALVSVLVPVVLAGIVVRARVGVLPIDTYLPFAGLVGLYTVVWTTAAVTASALGSTRGRVLAGVLGFYFVFGVIRNFLPSFNARTVTSYVVESALGRDSMPVVYAFVDQLSPTLAFVRAGRAYLLGFDLTDAAPEPVAYFEGWFALVVLGAWVVLLGIVGYAGFRGRTLA